MNISASLFQLGGLVGDIFSGIGNFFMNYMSVIGAAIFAFAYTTLVEPIFLVIDIVTILFRKFAGLGSYSYEGRSQTGDVILSLINEPIVQDVFWALLILAVVLLIVFTIIAIVRQETLLQEDKGRKTKSQIFARALKSLISFFLVPVVAIVSIFLGNALLKAIDTATGGENAGFSSISSQVFIAAAYNSNRARTDNVFANSLTGGAGFDHSWNDFGVITGSTQEAVADSVDDAFKYSKAIAGEQHLELGVIEDAGFFGLFSPNAGGGFIHVLAIEINSLGTASINRACFTIYDAWFVSYYYNMSTFNYLIAIIAGLFTAYVLVSAAAGLIKRIFKLVIFLVISPPVIAMGPLDDGAALGKWRSGFIKSALMAYSTVVMLNLTLILLVPLQKIQWFYVNDTSLGGGVFDFRFVNALVNLFVICIALLFFKEVSKELADIIGAEDAAGAGADKVKQVAGTIGKAVATVYGAGAAAKAAGAAKKAKGLADKAGDKAKGLDEQMKGLDKDSAEYKNLEQERNDALKEQDTQNKLANNYQAQADARLGQVKSNAQGLADVATGGAFGAAMKPFENKDVAKAKAQGKALKKAQKQEQKAGDKAVNEYMKDENVAAREEQIRENAANQIDTISNDIDTHTQNLNKLQQEYDDYKAEHQNPNKGQQLTMKKYEKQIQAEQNAISSAEGRRNQVVENLKTDIDLNKDKNSAYTRNLAIAASQTGKMNSYNPEALNNKPSDKGGSGKGGSGNGSGGNGGSNGSGGNGGYGDESTKAAVNEEVRAQRKATKEIKNLTNEIKNLADEVRKSNNNKK